MLSPPPAFPHAPSSADLLVPDTPIVQENKVGQSRFKKPKRRTTFSQEQLRLLRSDFARSKYITRERGCQLAEMLGLNYKQVNACWSEGLYCSQHTYGPEGYREAREVTFPLLSGANYSVSEVKGRGPLLLGVCLLDGEEGYHCVMGVSCLPQVKSWFQNQRLKAKKSQIVPVCTSHNQDPTLPQVKRSSYWPLTAPPPATHTFWSFLPTPGMQDSSAACSWG